MPRFAQNLKQNKLKKSKYYFQQIEYNTFYVK